MFSIDPRSRVPLYEQLAENIKKLVVSGVLEADSQLPSVRQTSVELGINPNTVQRAYALCESRGILYSIPGRGHFAAPDSDSAREARLKEARDAFTRAVKAAYGAGLTREQLAGLLETSLKEEESHA